MSDSEATRNKYEKWAMPLIAELFGMTFFTFMHCLATYSLPVVASAINDGFFVAVMVITIGPVSGALINPAVTIAVALSGGLKWAMVPLCVAVQLIGSLCGAALARVACGSASGYFSLGPGVDLGQAVLTEVTLTILLVFTALQAGLDFGSPVAAFAVGFAVICDIMVGAKISGAAMNPALSFGPAVVAGAWTDNWIYWVGPLGGALVAVALHKLALASRKNRLIFRRHNSEYEDTSTKKRESDEIDQVSPV